MPSTLKTQNLGLNKFIAADKPKMDDFNFDNQTLDTKISGHFTDTVKHFSPADRIALTKAQMILGRYTGNGTDEQIINLGWKPSAGIVYSPDYVPYRCDPNYVTTAEMTSAFFSTFGSTLGIELVANGFKAKMGGARDPNIETVALNLANVNYVYMVWR